MKREEKIKQRLTTEEWMNIVELYFEAETTEEEELALRHFLTSEESNLPCFNEIKAVMGYIATGKNIKRKGNRQQNRIRPFGNFIRYSAAAIITIIIGFGVWKSVNDNKNICIAYIDGKYYNDEKIVLTEMHKALAHIGHNIEENTIEQQLGNFFRCVDNEDTTVERNKRE